MAEPVAGLGQAAPANSGNGTTAAAPSATQGQSAAPSQTTVSGSGGESESFFDPKSLEGKPELQSAYKQMQGKFTKEMQKFKEASKKASAYDTFAANPGESLKTLAKQLGYNLVQSDPKAKDADDTPKTWGDVYNRAKQEVLKEIQPMLGEVRNLKQQNVESYLDNNHPDWRTFESEMLDTLQKHPSLAGDPDNLYRLSVPSEVLEARAHKAALAKLRGSSEAGQISGPGKTTQTAANDAPKIGASFNDHVAYAKQQLAAQGIRPLAE
jgi:hypothetical protein